MCGHLKSILSLRFNTSLCGLYTFLFSEFMNTLPIYVDHIKKKTASHYKLF